MNSAEVNTNSGTVVLGTSLNRNLVSTSRNADTHTLFRVVGGLDFRQ